MAQLKGLWSQDLFASQKKSGLYQWTRQPKNRTYHPLLTCVKSRFPYLSTKDFKIEVKSAPHLTHTHLALLRLQFGYQQK